MTDPTTPPESLSAERVRRYLDEREKMSGVDADIIHFIIVGSGHTEAITVTDLRALIGMSVQNAALKKRVAELKAVAAQMSDVGGAWSAFDEPSADDEHVIMWHDYGFTVGDFRRAREAAKDQPHDQ